MSFSEQMLTALEKGDQAQARELFTQALQHDDDETLYNLAGELYALGFIAQAQRLYEELLGKYPEMDDLRANLADIAVSNGDADKALNYLAQIKPDSDSYVAGLMTQADVYQTQGLYEVSEQKLLTAQRLAPDEPVVTFALGELYFDWGKDSQAALAYSDLIAAGVDDIANVSVKARYGAVLANLGQYEDAVAVFEELGDTLDFNSRFTLGGLYLQLKDYPRAIDALKAVLEEDASFANAYLPLAQAQVADHQSAEALSTVQAGIQVDDTNPDLFAVGADLALKEADNDLATTYLQKARAIDPENQAVMLAWSNLLLAKHEDEDNIAFLEAIDKSGDVDPQIYWNLAKSYDRLDDVEHARENYLLAFGSFQDSPDFLRDIIDFFQSTAAIAELKSALTRYVALVPDDDQMQARLDELNAEN